METRFLTAIKRNLAIFAFIIYVFLLVYIGGHIEVEPVTSNIFRYSFAWKSQFVIDTITLIFLIIIPFVISYISAVSGITRNSKMVQIIGPRSLIRNVETEFHVANPERRGELTKESAQAYLSEMAQGEPEGTFDNLEMLFNTGVLVKDLLEKSGVKSIKRVYVSDDLTPNAFTLRIIPLPFIGQDWIIINRNVIDILDPLEIQGVVAHEIGHAARKDSWINSILYSPRLVIIFAWSVLLANMASYILNDPLSLDVILRIISLLMLFVLIRILMNAGLIFTNYAYRKAELLSDYYAAQLVGSEVLINALVKIGQRAEVIRAISTELKWLNKQVNVPEIDTLAFRLLHMLDPNEFSRDKARNLAVQVYIQMYLMEIFRGLRIPIDREQFEEFVNQSATNLQRERGMKIEEGKVMLPFDQSGVDNIRDLTTSWQDADVDKNLKLDPSEIEVLVNELKQGKKLFENEALESLGLIEGIRTHPQFSDRIIFVYDNILKK